MTISNRDFGNPAAFRRTLEGLGATVVNTYPHWTVTNWKQLGTGANASAKDSVEDDKKSAESRPSAPPASKSTSREASAGRAKKKL